MRHVPEEYGLASIEKYQHAGYAHLVDNLLSGCYYPEITEQEAAHRPAFWYSVEGAARLAKQVILEDAPVTASLFLDQYRSQPRRIEQAIQMCFAQTGRCMLFDLSYLEQDGWWPHAQRSAALCPLTEEELPELHRLLQRTLPAQYDWGKARLEQVAVRDPALLPEGTLCLKTGDGRLLGAVVSKQFAPGEPPYGGAGCVSMLLVDPEIQNRGWGSCLLKAAEQDVYKRQLQRICTCLPLDTLSYDDR